MNKKRWLLILGCIILGLLTFLLFLLFEKSKNNTIIISNLDNYFSEIPSSDKNNLQNKLFSYVSEQNDINNIETKNYYYGEIRDNSSNLQTTESDNIKIYSASFILDIKSLQYSYKVKFSWSNDDISTTSIDLGTTEVYCPSENDLIYGDFNCSKNSLIDIEVDPILDTNLVLSDYCWSSPFQTESNSGYGINIYYHPTTNDYINNQVDQSFNQCVLDIKNNLQEQGIDLNNYRINSQIKYFYNY